MSTAQTQSRSSLARAAEELLTTLVAISSPSGEENQAVQALVAWMQDRGYDDAYIDEAGNAVGIMGTGDRDIILLGHIDTFPGNPPVHIKDRLLYGRGSVDAKGPLCAFAVTATQVALPANTRLVVIGAVEEESATSKGARYAATCFQPEACVIGEPSRWDRITLGYKGRLLIEWRWEGGLSHSAGRDLSPADRAIRYAQLAQEYVNAFNKNRNGVFERLDMSVRDLNTGDTGAHGSATMNIGFRLPPDLSPETLAYQLKPDDNATIRPYAPEKAFVAEKDTSLSRAFRAAIRADHGKPRFVYKTGTSDMNVVGPIWNCPIVAYGPGDSALDHTPDEHLELDEYLQSIRVLQNALERFCHITQ